MKVLLILIVICLISCENKAISRTCVFDFEIPENTVNSEGIITDLKLHQNILKVCVYNLRNDSLHFAVPHIIFAKEAAKHNIEESDIVVKQFIPNIVTDKVTAYRITKNDKKIISVDSSKTRDVKQYEFKLAPKEIYVAEYILNCRESDPEKYRIFFFESNRFDNIKYEKIKYPENGYIEVKK
jgi:hypothetical protein